MIKNDVGQRVNRCKEKPTSNHWKHENERLPHEKSLQMQANKGV